MNISNVSQNTSQYQHPIHAQNQVARHPDHDGDADDNGSVIAPGTPAQPESAEGGNLNVRA